MKSVSNRQIFPTDISTERGYPVASSDAVSDISPTESILAAVVGPPEGQVVRPPGRRQTISLCCNGHGGQISKSVKGDKLGCTRADVLASINVE